MFNRSFSFLKSTFSSNSTLIPFNYIKHYCTVNTIKPVSIILSGAGFLDGTDITESVSVIINLSNKNIEYQCYSLDKNQTQLMNHKTAKEDTGKRNIMDESARISRGNILPLSDLIGKLEKETSAIIFPGGLGAAKNLSNFATKAVDMEIEEEVRQIIQEARFKNIPQAFIGVSPILAAKSLKGLKLTVGKENESSEYPYAGTALAITALGSSHISKEFNEICIDKENLIISTPSTMHRGSESTIFLAIEKMIDNLVLLMEKK